MLDECAAILDPEETMTNEHAAQPDAAPPTREEEIARKAAQFVKSTKPQLKKFIESARPQAENAGREAARYVREHETEIKDAALKLAQARLGPLGMVVGSIANGVSNEKGPAIASCSGCGTSNPRAANFCNECGQRLSAQPGPA